jgi:hypothetical protein
MIFKRDEPAWEGGNALLKGMFFASISTYTTGLFEGWMIYWNLFRSSAAMPKPAEKSTAIESVGV